MDEKKLTVAEAAAELGIAGTADEAEVTAETVEELTNGKGDDEDE